MFYQQQSCQKIKLNKIKILIKNASAKSAIVAHTAPDKTSDAKGTPQKSALCIVDENTWADTAGATTKNGYKLTFVAV